MQVAMTHPNGCLRNGPDIFVIRVGKSIRLLSPALDSIAVSASSSLLQ